MTEEYLTLTELAGLWQRDLEYVLNLLERHKITVHGDTSDGQPAYETVNPDMHKVATADCRRLEWKLFRIHARVWSARRGSPLQELPPRDIPPGKFHLDYYDPLFLADAPIHFALLWQPQAKVRWIKTHPLPVPTPPTTPEVLDDPPLGSNREQSQDSTATDKAEQLQRGRNIKLDRLARHKAAVIEVAQRLWAENRELVVVSTSEKNPRPSICSYPDIASACEGQIYTPDTIRRWVSPYSPNRDQNKRRHGPGGPKAAPDDE